jgi:uncharacterized RDD family membrane protein YckC
MPPTETHHAAGLARRLAAMSYDWFLLIAILFAVTLIFVVLSGGEAIAPGTWWFDLSLIAAAYLFFGWFWTHGGQTLGMRAWKIRVETADGGRLGWPEATRRFFASAVLFLPPGLGLLWAVFDPERRCWHDRLSRTRIVRSAA